MKLLRDITNEYLSWKWSLWILFLFPYGWKLKSQLIGFSDFLGSSINLWDLVIEIIMNPFLIIYFIFPFLLLLFNKVLLQNGEYITLIRLRSYIRWIFYTIGKVIPGLLVLLILWLVISFLVTISIPAQMSWSSYAMKDYGVNYIIYSLQQYFFHPYIAIFVQILQYFLFFITVYTIMATFYLFKPTKNILVFLSASFYLGAIVSYKIPTELSWLHITNYAFTHSSIDNFQSVLPAFSILTVIFSGCLVVIKLFKK